MVGDIKSNLIECINFINKKSKGVIFGLNIHNDGERIRISKFDKTVSSDWRRLTEGQRRMEDDLEILEVMQSKKVNVI